MDPQALSKRDRRWQQVQAVTGLTFALFVLTHLTNTLVAVAAASARFAIELAGSTFCAIRISSANSPSTKRINTLDLNCSIVCDRIWQRSILDFEASGQVHQHNEYRE